MSLAARTVRWIVLVTAAVLALVAAGVVILARTDFGAERVGRLVIGKIEGGINGELRVGDLDTPWILSGATLFEVAIDGPDGRPFLRADSARLDYDWRTFLGGNIVFDAVDIYGAELTIERLPGDTLWNYDYLFRSEPAGPRLPPPVPRPPPQRDLILLRDATLSGTTVVLRRPWTPDGPVAPEDTADMNLESVPGGIANVWRFERIEAALPRVVWSSPSEEGRLFEVRSLATDAYVWERPIEVRDMRGTLTVRDSIVAFDAEHFELPSSRGTLLGRIVVADPENRYDVRIESDEVALRDLRWLHPGFPDVGGGTLVMRIRTQAPGRMLWLAEEARLSAPGSEIAGSFGMVTGDTAYFTNVDLRAEPLNLEALRSLIPEGLPVEGLRIGTATLEGPG